MRRSLFVFGALLALIAPASARTLDVVASFTILADVVRQVGGAHVHVVSLVPPNGDPHEYEPSPDDVRRLGAADLVFVSGDGLETWFERLTKASGFAKTPIAVSRDVPVLTETDDGRNATDPHVWNDPRNVMRWATVIADALSEADPADRADFRAQAEAYRARLEDADRYARRRFDPIPAERRKVLTSHDAFGYFARAYGIRFIAPLGLSTDTEPSAAVVAGLIGQIRREGVKVYFLESSVDARLVRQIGAATGARPGGTLYVEALSEPGGPAADYLSMFRLDVDLLADAMTR